MNNKEHIIINTELVAKINAAQFPHWRDLPIDYAMFDYPCIGHYIDGLTALQWHHKQVTKCLVITITISHRW